MSAQILKMEKRHEPTPLARHLNGHHSLGPTPGGPLGRMQSESAVRAYIRHLARRLPVSDSGGRENVWTQVEDITALVPMLSSSVQELDAFAHALRTMLSLRAPGRLVATDATFRSCRVEISATGNVLKLRMIDPTEVRIVTVKLHRHGADRLDDRMASA